MKRVIGLMLVMAAGVAPAHETSNSAAVGELMKSWQARILSQNLPVDDARNWSRRNMAKFGRLSDERLALAQRAATLDELEMVLVEAPLVDGARLDVLMANKPGDIAMMGHHDVAKSSPATSPSSYSNLVFTALTPCRILDTRISQGGGGSWTAISSNLVKIGPYSSAGGGYQSGPGAQGGSTTSCGLDALAGPGQIAVIMAAVSTVSQASAGYLTFYPQGAPNPGASSVSQWYQTGYVQTSFVLIPTDLVGTVAALSFTSASTEVIIDVVGYFSQAAPDGVTSVATGSGLTGGPITTTGTISLAATNLLPTVACATNQIPKWSGTAWACAADATGGGAVTGVTASAPIASSGGAAPNISLAGTVPVANGGTGQTSLTDNGVLYGQNTGAVANAVGSTGQVLTGFTGGAPTWTGSPSISGDLTLVHPSVAGAGNIMKGPGHSFIHNTGAENTFVGEDAGNFTMSGIGNTALGLKALNGVTVGGGNTATGAYALLANASGAANTANGYFALQSNSTANSNTAMGFFALQFNTAGSNNTAIGDTALGSNTTGGSNTALGVNALSNNTTGGSNIALGTGAATSTTGSGNIIIGNPGVAAENGTIRIGASGPQTRAFIAGIRGVTTGAAAITVLIDSNGQLGTVSSSRYVKDDIADMASASSALMKLRPVTFHYKSDQSPAGRTLQYGLVAEEVANVYPGLIARSNDGKIETVMYQFLPPMLLNEYQKQQRTIATQAARIEALEMQAARTAQILDELQNQRR